MARLARAPKKNSSSAAASCLTKVTRPVHGPIIWRLVLGVEPAASRMTTDHLRAVYRQPYFGSVAKGMERRWSLVLIRGLPGSGKATMARAFEREGYEQVEADDYFEQDGSHRFDASLLQDAHSWCLARAKAALANGRRCVVANTFVQRWQMAPYIAAAKELGAALRIVEASGNWSSTHNAPPEVIDDMRLRLESIDA